MGLNHWAAAMVGMVFWGGASESWAQTQVVTTEADLVRLTKACTDAIAAREAAKKKNLTAQKKTLEDAAQKICNEAADREAAVLDKRWFATVKDGNCKSPGFSAARFQKMGDEYAMARADACLGNQPHFYFRSKKYETKTGKLIR